MRSLDKHMSVTVFEGTRYRGGEYLDKLPGLAMRERPVECDDPAAAQKIRNYSEEWE